ncbi:HEPN-associated N-terminal domain-containing protein [Massilia phyllosphaerae]|uniref:HEPN-associated N-terminal domain-containing protein n=1 Tax=Massilia phyllosphaerae TaxID=3106034 RepID=UPI002B1CB73B|nr:HEPN-associated N-terminal domain-containing protein [Massilia sp. SGZ-792]
MGLAKSAWMAALERGWDAPDTWVCRSCVGDDFLAEQVDANVEECECSYCGEKTEEPSAAPTEPIMESIAGAVFYYFSSLEASGIPYDSEDFAMHSLDIREVLGELSLNGQEKFVEDVAGAFTETAWVRSSHAFWNAPRLHQKLGYAWESFVQTVKHHTRFHFLIPQGRDADDPDHIPSEKILSTIAGLLRNFDMLREVPTGTKIYRCRIKYPQDNWKPNEEQLGAPPSERASAGRMNPAGISYFYGAFAYGTALGEIASHPPMAIGVGTFENIKPLMVVDLTKLADIPSVFDSDNRNEREALLFLEKFTEEISQPIRKNGMEHINYLPSQVVSEYLAQVFEIDESGRKIDGIVFPSSIKPGCNNIVLFPSDRNWKIKFDKLKFVDGKFCQLDDWQSVIKSLGMDDAPKGFSGLFKGI